MVKIETADYKKTATGWKIIFNIILSTEESSKLNLDPIKYVGDYEIKKESDSILLFISNLDAGELEKDETIEERLDLIKIDIENLVKSCL
jgi:hypothetical protein